MKVALQVHLIVHIGAIYISNASCWACIYTEGVYTFQLAQTALVYNVKNNFNKIHTENIFLKKCISLQISHKGPRIIRFCSSGVFNFSCFVFL